MGTHPIFESDFDCLTECERKVERKWEVIFKNQPFKKNHMKVLVRDSNGVQQQCKDGEQIWKIHIFIRAIWVTYKRLDYLLYLMVIRVRSMRIKWQKNFRIFWRARNHFQISKMAMIMIPNRSRLLFENLSYNLTKK